MPSRRAASGTDRTRGAAPCEGLSVKAFMAAHPRRAHREISHSILGERVFRRVLGDAEPGRYSLVFPMLSGTGRPIEDAVGVEDPVIAEHLAAVFDRVEERLRDEARKHPPEWMR